MSELHEATFTGNAPKEVTPIPTVIKAENPTAEEMTAIIENIKVNHDFDVDVKSTTFNFKRSKDKDTNLETVREPLQIALAVPSVNGLVAILEAGGKQLELMLEIVENYVIAAARTLITDDLKINAANFPNEKVTFDFLANLPKAQRRGGGIPKEDWTAFAEDYIDVMPSLTGKPIEAVANMAKIMVNRLAVAKTNEPVLLLVTEMLGIYSGTPNFEEHKEVVAFLLSKADDFLNISDEDLLANL